MVLSPGGRRGRKIVSTHLEGVLCDNVHVGCQPIMVLSLRSLVLACFADIWSMVTWLVTYSLHY